MVAILAGLCFFTSVACMAVLIARNRMHRHHRVDPAVRTEAPMTWLVDPRAAARLHRRLAKVGTAATTVVEDHRPTGRRRRKAEPSPLAITAGELREQAVLLDLQVARVSVLAPAARRQPLADLGRAINEVETASARLVALSAQVRAPRRLNLDDPGLTAVTQQIDRLAEAHQELLGLDAQAQLVPVTQAAFRPPPPQTWPPST